MAVSKHIHKLICNFYRDVRIAKTQVDLEKYPHTTEAERSVLSYAMYLGYITATFETGNMTEDDYKLYRNKKFNEITLL